MAEVDLVKPGHPLSIRAEAAEPAQAAAQAPEAVDPLLNQEDLQEEESRQLRSAQMQQFAQAAVFAGYAVVVALGIVWHEPWADEAQAWLLARDQGFWHLMFHSLRYEGAPGLWHALLWVMARAHVSYAGMHWVAGFIALLGVYVLLRWSPFPLILKILLPFGFWLAYQDAVVARSYVPYAVLAFAAAAILRNIAREDAPAPRSGLIGLAVLLGLIANISLHGFIASLGFAVVAVVILHRKSRAGMLSLKAVPALVVCCFWLFAVATVFPPSDVDFVAGRSIQRSVEKMWAHLGSQEAKRQLAATGAADVRPGELTPLPPIEVHRTSHAARWRKAAHALSLMTFPISTFRWLALACTVLIVAQTLVFGPSRGAIGWFGLAPWLLMVVAFLFLYIAPRHCGMLWESLLAALWLIWPVHPGTRARVWFHRMVITVLVVVAADQVWWTGHALWGDMRGPYSGDRAMAKFLASQGSGKQVAGFTYHSVGPAAYFNHPIYFNQPTTYWIYSRNVRIDSEASLTIARHPDIIVVGGFEWNERNSAVSDDWIRPDPSEIHRAPLEDMFQIIPYAEAHGYRETHRFCGHAFMRNGYSEVLCQVALEPIR